MLKSTLPNKYYSTCKMALILFPIIVLTSAPVPAQQTDTAETDGGLSVFDAVDDCDLLAAHPGDLSRMSQGVEEAALVPRAATLACEVAVERTPDELRFSYQLGRALLAANRLTDAQPHLGKAARGGYAAAMAALADLDLKGVGEADIRKDQLAAAFALHTKAAAAGFLPSITMGQAMRFDGQLYSHTILGQIADGNFDQAKEASARADVRAYFYSFLTNLMSDCGPILKAETVVRLALYRFGGSVSAEQEETVQVSLQPLLGEIDAQRFALRHGCTGPNAGTLFLSNVAKFLAAD